MLCLNFVNDLNHHLYHLMELHLFHLSIYLIISIEINYIQNYSFLIILHHYHNDDYFMLDSFEIVSCQIHESHSHYQIDDNNLLFLSQSFILLSIFLNSYFQPMYELSQTVYLLQLLATTQLLAYHYIHSLLILILTFDLMFFIHFSLLFIFIFISFVFLLSIISSFMFFTFKSLIYFYLYE